VKELTGTLAPLLKLLGGSKKLVLTPMARYWVTPCCSDPEHLTNYCTPGYLPRLGEAVASLRDHIRDALFTRRVSNFRVLCPNKMFGMGLRRNEISDEEAARTAALWGPDPVHPTAAAYRMIAGAIEADLMDVDARYTNPPKGLQTGPKKARHDPSRERAGWVDGCSAALPRRDSAPVPGLRGWSANSYSRFDGSTHARLLPRAWLQTRPYPLWERSSLPWAQGQLLVTVNLYVPM
jgi:hypothetical protein